MNICSYLTGFFRKMFFRVFGRNFNPQFFRYRSWFEAFLNVDIGDGGGAP